MRVLLAILEGCLLKKVINIQPIAAVPFIKIAFLKFRVKANVFNYILLI